MHKRRVSEDHLNGNAQAKVCEDCYEAFWKAAPTLSKWCLSNYNWLGRHLPLLPVAPRGPQNLDWKADPEIVKSIVQFYSKAKALEQLSAFFDACAQVAGFSGPCPFSLWARLDQGNLTQGASSSPARALRQIEIDDYRDYEKALAALKESHDWMNKVPPPPKAPTRRWRYEPS